MPGGLLAVIDTKGSEKEMKLKQRVRQGTWCVKINFGTV
jgi:hypothetical protein